MLPVYTSMTSSPKHIWEYKVVLYMNSSSSECSFWWNSFKVNIVHQYICLRWWALTHEHSCSSGRVIVCVLMVFEVCVSTTRNNYVTVRPFETHFLHVALKAQIWWMSDLFKSSRMPQIGYTTCEATLWYSYFKVQVLFYVLLFCPFLSFLWIMILLQRCEYEEC